MCGSPHRAADTVIGSEEILLYLSVVRPRDCGGRPRLGVSELHFYLGAAAKERLHCTRHLSRRLTTLCRTPGAALPVRPIPGFTGSPAGPDWQVAGPALVPSRNHQRIGWRKMLRAASVCGRKRAPQLAQRRGWHDVWTWGRLGLPGPELDPKLPPVLRGIMQAMHARPRLCAVVCATTAAAAGDICAQALSELKQSDERASIASRAARVATHAGLVGILVGGAGDVWFRALVLRFPGHTYEAALRSILDQVLCTSCPL